MQRNLDRVSICLRFFRFGTLSVRYQPVMMSMSAQLPEAEPCPAECIRMHAQRAMDEDNLVFNG